MYGIFLCLNLFIWGSRRPFTRSFDVFYKVLCFSLWLAFINVVTRTRTSRSSKLWKICFKNKQSLWPKSNDRRRIMQINSNLDANFCNQSRFSAFSSLIRSSVQLMWKDVVFCTTRYWSSCTEQVRSIAMTCTARRCTFNQYIFVGHCWRRNYIPHTS